MTVDERRLESEIRCFLREELRIDEREIARDTALFTSGTIDSMALVRLAALLERESGLTIPDADVEPEHFDSIERILAYLRVRLSAASD